MAIHEAYARITPYELLQPDDTWAERHFPGVEDEARQRGTDLWNPAAFALVGAVSGALNEIRPDDVEGGHDYGLLVYFAYHIWSSAGDLVLATGDTVRRAIWGPSAPEGGGGAGDADEGTEPPPEAWSVLSGRAGYVQLPQHLVWLEGQEGETPESVDGFLWAGTPREVLHLAFAAGIRGDRPGLLVIPVPPQPFKEMRGWMEGPARQDGEAFATGLPGAELEGLLGLSTPAEALRLAASLLALRVRMAGAPPLDPEGEGTPGPEEGQGPRRTGLPYRVV
ncbi:MAG: hypothetical protein OEO23_01880 [Gemmatimonadota bacterium]|nr:hypothetical protein [Gemmatimonadota bacterium]